MTKPAGVYRSVKKNGQVYYRISITYRGRHISLGSNKDINAAAEVYKEASALLHGDDDIGSYSSYSHIPYDKFIVLINFRDNGVYFHNPVYLHQRYFSYFLDKNTELKFDTDDLFFYSQHRIQRRGGHLFVENYGTQMSVHSRYGLHPFSVPGRDFRFMNGDDTDYRYENLEIINRYIGVELLENTIPKKYRSYIHVKGYYNLGIFDTEEKAAIAFNKARKALKDAGIKKDTPANYISDMSEEEYLKIYNEIVLPDNFLKFLARFSDVTCGERKRLS